MHVIFREKGGLEESTTPQDLGQTPGDLVVLSFSDSDLASFAHAWRQDRDQLPSLRLAQLARLTHPVSVDQYITATLHGARFILVRLLGGRSYWDYGVMALQDLARRRGIALAFVEGDGAAINLPKQNASLLAQLSTVSPDLHQRLSQLCAMGGHQAAGAALRLMAGLDAHTPAPLPEVGWLDHAPQKDWIAIPFYRSWMLAGDLQPITALIAAIERENNCPGRSGLAAIEARGIYLPSLKSKAAQDFLRTAFKANPPKAIINTTAFSTQDADCALRSGPPVFQAVLSTATQALWADSQRGLSPADMAMHVVLPEVDGRIPAQIISLKDTQTPDPDLQIALPHHQPLADRIQALAQRVRGWIALQSSPNPTIAVVLSTYPGKPWLDAHAVGLDATQSAQAILRSLGENPAPIAPRLRQETIGWPIKDYLAALALLPKELQSSLQDHWGAPQDDPQIHDDHVHFHALHQGRHLVALQPERGLIATREASYHDLSAPPRHAYVAFYLWLRGRVQALVHLGAHGTLEWLPGKAVAQSLACWPEALTGALPVIYPFIVNDPGEAAQARRRLGAVTLGHMPPALKPAQLPEKFVSLEHMLDRYATADGIDPARRDRLAQMIRDEAEALGLFAQLGLDVSQDAQALGALDRFVCELKESRYTDGLHIWGQAVGEHEGLARALGGRHVAPGPSGSPWRGAADVMPTGRNLYAVDPRALPTPEAVEKGRLMAAEFIRTYLQDHGDWPTSVMIDLWGSATMRTGGEDFAMALALAGLTPIRDPGTGRVTGIEVLPLAEMDHPRILVTLKISGLFRDSFPVLIQLFVLGCQMLAARGPASEIGETPGDNPYLADTPRIFGPSDGNYGTGIALDGPRHQVAAAWLANGGFSHDGQNPSMPDQAGLAQALHSLSAHLHSQDLPESDLLMAEDYAAHIGGAAAAIEATGNKAALYHLDNTRQDRIVLRDLGAELARITHTRAGAPAWSAAMMRHGARGAAEITASLDHLAAFARLTGQVAPQLFDEIARATLLDGKVMAFFQQENPLAGARLIEIFLDLLQGGQWSTRHNEILAHLFALGGSEQP